MRILHAPLYGPGAKKNPKILLDSFAQYKADVIAPTEAYGCIPQLRSFTSHRLILEQDGEDTRRGQKDNPLLVKHSLVSRGSGQVFGCRASTPEKIAPERWLTWSSVVDKKGLIHSHVSAHPHAVVQDPVSGGFNKSPRAGVVEEEFLPNLEYLLGFLKDFSFYVTFSGDVNFRDLTTRPQGIYRVLKHYNMKWLDVGLDVVAWSSGARVQAKKVGRPDSISDHPWLLLTY